MVQKQLNKCIQGTPSDKQQQHSPSKAHNWALGVARMVQPAMPQVPLWTKKTNKLTFTEGLLLRIRCRTSENI